VFAIGMKSGVVKLYRQTTCREIASLDHGEPARFLEFSTSSHLLASGGYRQIKMWSANGDLIWKISHEGILSTMSFAEGVEDLVVAHGSGVPGLAATDLDHTRRHHDHHVPSGPGQTRGSILSASKVLFNPNPSIELLAVSYQDGELAIFNTWAGGDRRSSHSLPMHSHWR
jgi:hypothetical protein